MKEKLRRALTLFVTFFKIGAFTFGGGYAMIPLIQREVVENHKWITDDDILDIVAIAESTPGPIAINSATFVGYRVCGVLGSAAATLGTVLPSFTIILIISAILTQFQELEAVKFAFMGIRGTAFLRGLKIVFHLAPGKGEERKEAVARRRLLLRACALLLVRLSLQRCSRLY